MSSTASATLPPVNVQAQAAATKPSSGSHKQGAFSRVFHEILDIVNPLQHIPIISTIYRHLTGDQISPVAKVAGGALYGGLIGLGLSVADVAVQEATGEDVGDHVLAMFEGKHDTAQAATAVASSTPSAAGTTSAAQTAKAGDRIWFPAYPAGSVHPAALSFRHVGSKPASAATASTAPTAAPTSAPVKMATAIPTASPAAISNAIPAAQAATGMAPASANPTAGVPNMDQATFDALLRSFGGKAVAGINPAAPAKSDVGPRDAAGQPTDTLGAQASQNAQAAQPSQAAPTNPTATNPNLIAAKGGYAGALKAMQDALDRYQAQGGRIPPSVMPNGVPAI